MRHVTIKDIARIAGVSCSTVSRALSGSSELSEKTRERILEICRQEGTTWEENSQNRRLKRA